MPCDPARSGPHSLWTGVKAEQMGEKVPLSGEAGEPAEGTQDEPIPSLSGALPGAQTSPFISPSSESGLYPTRSN